MADSEKTAKIKQDCSNIISRSTWPLPTLEARSATYLPAIRRGLEVRKMACHEVVDLCNRQAAIFAVL